MTTEQMVMAAQLGMFQKELQKYHIDLKSNLSDEELLEVSSIMCEKYLKLTDVLKEAAHKAWPEMKFLFDIFDKAGA